MADLTEDFRIEHDSMGEMRVPASALWGAQTQRSYENFRIGTETQPEGIIRAFARLKKAAAQANAELGVLDADVCTLICDACDEVFAGKWDAEFPLKVWQTGSGTQSNMNVNEVVATRANQLAAERGIELAHAIHPNDHVNCSQSSNDTYPSAMHIAAVVAVREQLIPAARQLIATLARLERENEGIVKSGRTHLQDAVPIAFSQEISGWRGLVECGVELLEASLPALCRCASSRSAARPWARASTPRTASTRWSRPRSPNSPASPSSPIPTSSTRSRPKTRSSSPTAPSRRSRPTS